MYCFKSWIQQESPPAWTQEAYRPPCSEYSFCCPTRVPSLPPGGVPDLGTPWGGVPDLVTPPGGVPDLGTPPGGSWPGYPPGGYLTWVPPRGGTWPGYPQGGYLTWVPPGGTWPGYPPGGVQVPPRCCLMAFWEMLQSIMGYGYPPCGQTDWWMDRRVSKHYLPSYYVRGR